MIKRFGYVSGVLLSVLLFTVTARAQNVGDPAPDFSYNSLGQGEITLSQYRGTVVYIFFFGYN